MALVGQVSFQFLTRGLRLQIIRILAKSTVSRMTATKAEQEARQQRLCGAVRDILQCIGEDPDREGLARTPELYSHALMWMTRGYEERLAGEVYFVFHLFFN
jgi:GTP cyclohydrolase I